MKTFLIFCESLYLFPLFLFYFFLFYTFFFSDLSGPISGAFFLLLKKIPHFLPEFFNIYLRFISTWEIWSFNSITIIIINITCTYKVKLIFFCFVLGKCQESFKIYWSFGWNWNNQVCIIPFISQFSWKWIQTYDLCALCDKNKIISAINSDERGGQLFLKKCLKRRLRY